MSDKKITSYADFIVKDSSSEKKGKIKSTSQFTIQVGNSLNDGSFTLKSGTIECNGDYGIKNVRKSKRNYVTNGFSLFKLF